MRGTSFRECNLKCADFSNADLTGAIFELAAIESIKAKGAVLEGVKVKGATFYGRELAEGDELDGVFPKTAPPCPGWSDAGLTTNEGRALTAACRSSCAGSVYMLAVSAGVLWRMAAWAVRKDTPALIR